MAQPNQTLVHIQSICAVIIRCVTAADAIKIEERFSYEDPDIYRVVFNRKAAKLFDRTAIIKCCNHPTAKGLLEDLLSEYGSNVDWYLEPGLVIDPKSRDIDEDDDYE